MRPFDAKPARQLHVAPDAKEKLPGGHTEHAAELATEKVPAVQDVGAKPPPGHAIPGGQGVEPFVACALQTNLEAHCEHVAARPAEKEPAAQGTAAKPPLHAKPAGQAIESFAACAGQNTPGEQSVQASAERPPA